MTSQTLASPVRLAPFIVMSALGCALWAAAFALVGMLAGAGRTRLDRTLCVSLLAVAAVASSRRCARRLGRREPPFRSGRVGA